MVHDQDRYAALSRALSVDRATRIPAEKETLHHVLLKLRALGSGPPIVDWMAQAETGQPAEDALRGLFLAFLEFSATRTLEMEAFIVAVRRELLSRIRSEPRPERRARYLEPCAALAIHCFFHEHVFAETPAEAADIDSLLERNAPDHDAVDMAIVAAYRPLRSVPAARKLPGVFIEHESSRFQRLLKLDILDALEEEKLKARIERLTPIGDRVSQAVRAQYEENPYPRWSHLSRDQARDSSAGAGLKILIAGCGTGHQALDTAAKYPAADILAIDLSTASLAYAMRSTVAYGFRGLRFMQADLLELEKVQAEFDVIFCSGVLHHLHEPERGLAALNSRLKPGGRLHLAVYSNSGRRWFHPATALRDRLGLTGTLEGIRAFRAAIAALPETDPARRVALQMDFYFTSTCRDLAFHVQEHRYDLPQLARMFERHGLAVEALKLTPGARDLFLKYFPDADPERDLDRWGEVEARHDNLFGSMYSLRLHKQGR